MFGLSMIGEAREFEKKICFDDIVFQAEFQSTSHRLTIIKSRMNAAFYQEMKMNYK